jgi:hypothetical protein
MTRSVMQCLGYAGLIPFVVSTQLVLSGSPYAALLRELAAVYT